MSDSSGRVGTLIASRRAGIINLRQFKAEIERFTNGELACLAAALLETRPGRRERLEAALRQYGEDVEEFSRQPFATKSAEVL